MFYRGNSEASVGQVELEVNCVQRSRTERSLRKHSSNPNFSSTRGRHVTVAALSGGVGVRLGSLVVFVTGWGYLAFTLSARFSIGFCCKVFHLLIFFRRENKLRS